MNSRHEQLTIRTYWLWPTIVIGGLIVLALIPGGFAEKSKLLLHGLCAQTSGHTFNIGGQLLPFDARMTGIYSGVLGTLGYLALRRRLLAQHLPPKPILAVLASFIVAMGLDGFNSLLTDLGLWHPWTTTNLTRLVTGYLAGVTMSVALVWLVSGTVFHLADRNQIMGTWNDLLGAVTPLALVLAALRFAPAWMYIPFSTLLVAGAWTVLGTLALVTMLLITRTDERIVRRAQLHIPGAVGLVIGLCLMLLLAVGRQWLERTLGIPSTL